MKIGLPEDRKCIQRNFMLTTIEDEVLRDLTEKAGFKTISQFVIKQLKLDELVAERRATKSIRRKYLDTK